MNPPVEAPSVIPHALEVQFARAIDLYIADMRSYGRINSDGSERAYRRVLDLHRKDVQNRDPRMTGREDCKATLARWPNPNTQRASRSILVSFYDWAVEEGVRPTNPARQTHRVHRVCPVAVRDGENERSLHGRGPPRLVGNNLPRAR